MLTGFFLIRISPDGLFQFFELVFSTVIIAAAGYLINDYYDVETDRINKPRKVWIETRIKPLQALQIYFVFNALGLISAAFLGVKIFIINLICILLLWLYSFQLKKMPLTGNLIVSFLTALSILIIGIWANNIPFSIYAFAFFAFFSNLIREIIKDAEDWEGDQASDFKTFPIVFGLKKTKALLGLILIILSSGLFYFLELVRYGSLLLWIVALIFFLIYIFYYIFRAKNKDDFSRISKLLKWFMLLGMVGIILYQ